MELPQESDEFVKHTIDNLLGLPVPEDSLQLKIRSLESSSQILRNQYLSVLSKLKQKEQAVELARAEACLNAQAMKKFVEENTKLAAECENLLRERSKLEKECSLYDRDRDALMDFGNEADARAKEAETKVGKLVEELKERTAEVQYYKQQIEMLSDGSSEHGTIKEQKLVSTLVASLVNNNEVSKTASAYLQDNSENETCSELLKMLNSLRPETQNIISLANHVRTLQKDKEHLMMNLHRAEEEVTVLAKANNILEAENKRLLRLSNPETKHDGSSRTKKYKRTSPLVSSPPVQPRMFCSDAVSLPCPISPLEEK
ncbi:unnamed protein product [Amaranthus hypochondriacus]